MVYSLHSNWVRDQLYRQWFFEWCLDSKDIVRALLWPYHDPEKQLQWLKTSLDELDEDTQQFISEAYDLYNREWRIYAVYTGVPQREESDSPDPLTLRNTKE